MRAETPAVITETPVEMAMRAETPVVITETPVEMAMRAETPAAMVTIDRRARKSYYLVSEPSTHWRYSGLSDAAFMAAF